MRPHESGDDRAIWAVTLDNAMREPRHMRRLRRLCADAGHAKVPGGVVHWQRLRRPLLLRRGRRLLRNVYGLPWGLIVRKRDELQAELCNEPRLHLRGLLLDSDRHLRTNGPLGRALHSEQPVHQQRVLGRRLSLRRVVSRLL